MQYNSSFSIIINKICAGTAPSNGAILDEFSEQHQPQNAQLTFFQIKKDELSFWLGTDN